MQFEMVTKAIVDPRNTADDVGTVRDLTQWYTSNLEEAIRVCWPDQYWWLHRRWEGSPQEAARSKEGRLIALPTKNARLALGRDVAAMFRRARSRPTQRFRITLPWPICWKPS